MRYLAIYLIIINVIAFFYFGFDKMISQANAAKRVSEKMLWFLAFIGGSVGALAGMHFFRHKTKKLSFQAVIAIILAIQIWVVYFFFFK